MQYIRHRSIFFLFLSGLLLRLSIIFFDFSFDVNNHIIWAKDLHARGFVGFFDTPSSEVYAHIFPNYPPLANYIFYLFYPLSKIIFSVSWWLNIHVPLFPSKLIYFLDQRFFLAGMMKLPAIMADLGLAYLSMLFAQKFTPQKKNLQLWIASLILFNPAFFYNSALWGQIDVIPLFFVTLSYYWLLFTKRQFLSITAYTLALLVKPTVIIFLPIYAIFYIRKFGSIDFLKSLVLANLAFWFFFFPFLNRPINIFSPYLIYWHKIIEAQSLPYVTNGAFNFWLFFVDFKDAVKDTVPFLLRLPFRIWGYVFTGISLLITIYLSLKIKDIPKALLSASFFTALAGFLFLTKMHERYLMLPLPFLLLLGIKDNRFLKWFYLVSFLSLINLYHSWPVPYWPALFIFLTNPFIYISLSAINIFVFFVLFLQFVKSVRFKNNGG